MNRYPWADKVKQLLEECGSNAESLAWRLYFAERRVEKERERTEELKRHITELRCTIESDRVRGK